MVSGRVRLNRGLVGILCIDAQASSQVRAVCNFKFDTKYLCDNIREEHGRRRLIVESREVLKRIQKAKSNERVGLVRAREETFSVA